MTKKTLPQFPVWTEIVCRNCSRTSNGEYTYTRINRSALIKQAKSRGWIFAHNEAFCGDDCLKNYEKFPDDQIWKSCPYGI